MEGLRPWGPWMEGCGRILFFYAFFVLLLPEDRAKSVERREIVPLMLGEMKTVTFNSPAEH